jgi:hypothetical protein
LLWLVGGTVAFWALLTYAARLLWPNDPVWVWSTTSAGVCLVPTVLTLLWTRWAHQGQPEQQLLAVLGGTAVRMVFVLTAGLILFYAVETFQYQRFWIFVIVYYLFTLALEMVVIVRSTAAEQEQRQNEHRVA